jgi:hypothetical protein
VPLGLTGQRALKLLELAHLSPLYRWIYATADRESYISTSESSVSAGNPQRSNADSLVHSYDWYVANRSHLAHKTGLSHCVTWAEGAPCHLG